MITRYIGFCPVCGGDWKIQGDVLVHHGYRRPGTGEIHGDCFGVGRPPHELSPETAEFYLKLVIIPEVRAAERKVEHYGPPNEPASLPFEEWNRETRQHEKVMRLKEDVPHYDWERRLDGARRDALMRLDAMREEVKRLETLIATWELKPLRTVEEFEREHRETKTVQQKRVSDDREQRSAHALVNFQQRIDRAVKKQDAGELRELFAGGWMKVLEPLGAASRLTREDALRLADRDDVWAALGFMRGGGYIERTEVPDWRFAHTWEESLSVAWPQARGVPKETLAQVKAERTAKKQAKLQKSIDARVEAEREQLDRALRTRDAKGVLNAFRGAALPLDVRMADKRTYPYGGPNKGRDEMLRLLGRDDVWAAFGWIRPDGSYFDTRDFEALLGPNEWDWDPRTQIPWPAGL